MRRVLLAAAVAASLSGCATIQRGGDAAALAICAAKDSTRMSLVLTIQNALLIENPVIRTSIVGAAEAQLRALDECP